MHIKAIQQNTYAYNLHNKTKHLGIRLVTVECIHCVDNCINVQFLQVTFL